jgi:hypothetical protein
MMLVELVDFAGFEGEGQADRGEAAVAAVGLVVVGTGLDGQSSSRSISCVFTWCSLTGFLPAKGSKV